MHWLNRVRWSYLLALLLVVSSIQSAQAQLVTVTVAGVDTLLETVKYGLKMAGKEDMATQIDGLLDALLQNEGFKGIDTKKSLGAYLNKIPANATQPPVVVYIPISNEADFLSFLGKLNVTPSKEENGTRSISLPTGQQVYLSFKHGYAFVCLDESEVKNPTNPAKFVAVTAEKGTLLFHVNLSLNEIPKELKDKFLAEVDKGINSEKEKKENEDKVEYQARLAAMNLSRQSLEHLVRDSEAFSVTVALDKNQHVFSFDTTLKPKAGTGLHNEFKQMANSKSNFSSLLEGSPASLALHGIINDALRQDMDMLIDSLVKKGITEEKSLVKKAVMEKVFQALEPTLKSKNYEFTMSMKNSGEGQPMTGLMAIRVKDGKKIEEVVKGLAVEMKERERQAIQFDAEKVNGVNLHVITIPADDKGVKDLTEVFGASKITLAFNDDYIIVGLGKQSTDEVKKFLTQPASSNVNPSPMQLLIHVKPFARFIKEAPVKKAFETIFTTPESDLIQASVTGGDKLQLKVEVSTHFLKLIEAAERARSE